VEASPQLESSPPENALVASEARYRRLFETAQDGILILDARSGLITDVNPFLTTLLDFSRDDFLGKTLWDIGACKQIQESKAAFRELQNKKYIRYDNLPLETRSGRRVNVEVVSNVYEENSKSVIQCNIRDIAARKQGEDALRRSEERFSKAFRSNPLAIAILTEPEGRYLDGNEAFLDLLGYQRKEVVGRTAAELEFWAEPLGRGEMIRQLEGDEKVAKHQMRYRTAKGKIRKAEVWAESIEVDGQRCVLAITRDVTEMMQLEAQLRQAQKMEAVGRLAGGIAHDFNNILNIIIGYSDLSLGLIAPENPVNQYVSETKKAAKRAALLTKQLLAFSRKQVVFPRTLDLNEVVRNATEMFLRLVGEDIAVEFHPTAPLGSVRADLGQIEQVLMNLVVNARDAMRPGEGS
jgi:two-component system, cell cycle sensor histidine kinase and response regulator CckA